MRLKTIALKGEIIPPQQLKRIQFTISVVVFVRYAYAKMYMYVCMLILLSFYYHLNKSLLVDVKCFQPWYIVQYDYHCLYFISDGWARSTSSYFRLGGTGSFGKNSSQKNENKEKSEKWFNF